MLNNNFKFLWGVFCQKCIVDKTDDTVSLITLIDKISITINKNKEDKDEDSVNFISWPITIVTAWEKVGKEKDIQEEYILKLIDPDKKELASSPGIVEGRGDINSNKSIINFNGLPITKNGKYTFRIFDKKEIIIAEIYLFIEIKTK